MQFMAWSEHFVTGFDGVDHQHHVLVDLVNEIAPLLADDSPSARATADQVIDRLFEYAATHFRSEEGLMRAGGIDPAYLAEHQRLHVAFVDEVVLMRMQLAQGGDLEGGYLLRFLSSWLTAHILGADQDMARQLRFIAGGMAPEAARRMVAATRHDDSANAVLHAALLDLFALNTERAKALSAANVELAAARDELARLNAGLEAEVRQRSLELAAAHAALVQAEKLRAVGQLAAGVAHELNTPIQYVSGNTHFLQRAFAGVTQGLEAWRRVATERAQDAGARAACDAVADELAQAKVDWLAREAPVAIEQALTGLRRMSGIVLAMQDLAGPGAEGKGPVRLDECVASAVAVSRHAWAAVAELETRCDPELPPVAGFRGELNQVVLNLLMNAVDAVGRVPGAPGPRGHIRIETRRAGDLAELRIADTGGGIPPDIRARVFEPFFTTKPVGSGAGLGLSVARAAVVDTHGGTLTFESEVGVGTTFIVRLPM